MNIGSAASVLCSALVLSASAAFAAPAVEWTATVPAPAEQWTYGMVALADGYAIGGTHLVQPGNPIHGGSEECTLARVGLDGAALWQRFYHAGYMSWCEGVAPAGDGFLLAGVVYPNYSYFGGRIVLIRTDADGIQLWQRLYDANEGGIDGTAGRDVAATGDGGFVVLAARGPVDLPGSSIMLLKVDADGNELWRSFPGDYYAEGLRIAPTADGGFVVSGWRSVGGAETAYLLRVDASGNRVWSATYPLGPMSSGIGVEQTPDGGFAVAGYAGQFGVGDLLDPFVLKVDADGAQQWATSFPAPGDGLGYDVTVAADGGVVFAGSERTPWSEETPQSGKAFVRKLGAGGELRWEVYPDAAPEGAWSHGVVIERTADGGYVLAGERTEGSEASTSYDVWVAKLAPEAPLPGIAVAIDVKPGSAENPINLSAEGTVPVAVLTTPGFDAATVAKATLVFAGAPVALKPNGRPQAALADVDRDGDLDLLAQFPIAALRLAAGDATATLTGATDDGAEIAGSDAVRVTSVEAAKR